MYKKIIGIIAGVAIFSLGYFGFSAIADSVVGNVAAPVTVVQAQAVTQSEAELAAEIAELRALVHLLLIQMLNNQNATTQPVPQVSVPQAPAPQVAGVINIPQTIVPRPAARAGGPANPAISAQRAVEIARDHLVANGVTSAWFDYVYMDVERGIWVWSVEFDGAGRSFEFYIDVNTGAFVQAPWGL